MSLIHLARQGFITKAALPNVTRQRGTTTGSANLMLYGAGKTTVSNNTTFVDSSTNAFTVTRNGDTVQSGFNPFSGVSNGAGFFDGAGDYLTAPNNAAFSFPSEFTVEMWIYPLTQLTISGGSTTVLFFVDGTNGLQVGAQSATAWGLANRSAGWRLTTSTFPTLNTWNHIAITRNSSNNTSIFLNGARVANGTVTDSFGAGSPFVGFGPAFALAYNGYLSNLRVVKGTAVYDPTLTTLTVPTSPLTAITNTSLLLLMDNYSIVNSTSTNLPISIFGNTAISTAQFPTGMSSSIYFDGTGDYLTAPNNVSFQFGSGDFTIENWVNFSSLPASNNLSAMVGLWDGSPYTSFSYLAVLFNNSGTYQLRFYYSTNGVSAPNIAVNWTPSLNTWYHIAFVRSSNSLFIFVNGTQIGSTGSLTGSLFASTRPLIIGSGSATEHPLNGYLSNVRLVKGAALYTANFTAPSAPLPLTVTVPAFVTNSIYGVYQLA